MNVLLICAVYLLRLEFWVVGVYLDIVGFSCVTFGVLV